MVVDEVARNNIKNIEKTMSSGFRRIDKTLDNMAEKSEEMFNHLSDRPSKAHYKTIVILTSVLSTVIGVAGAFLIAFLVGGS